MVPASRLARAARAEVSVAGIQRSSQGETLAVLALLLPLVAPGLALALDFEWWGTGLALSLGTVAATAVLLAIDAVLLGKLDLRGRQQGNAAMVFFGVLVLWIAYYPFAYFRRRHFGRPNLGFLAIPVAAFFVGVPVMQQVNPFSLFSRLPACTSRQVTAAVEELVRKEALDPVQSVRAYRETQFDKEMQKRTGQCVVKTKMEEINVTYHVNWVDRARGKFQIEIEPFTGSLPACTSPEVKMMVEDMIRQSPKGNGVQSVTDFRETQLDARAKFRNGQCQAKTATGAFGVTFQVKAINDKTFEVKILTGLEQPVVLQWQPGRPWEPPGPPGPWRRPGEGFPGPPGVKPWQQPGVPPGGRKFP